MKKILAILLALMTLLSFAACKKDEADESGKESNVEAAGKDIFSNNDGIDNFTYDINEHGFYEITGYSTSSDEMHEITIPSEINDIAVTGIGEEAFKACNTMSAVKIPDSVTYIGDLAFYGCSILPEVTVPDTVTSIGKGAFENCTALTKVVLPSTLAVISECLFYNCGALKDVAIPASVKSIGEGAFYGCTSLEEIVIPTGTESIGRCAFYGCEKLVKVTVPASVTEIGEAVFAAGKNMEIHGATGSAIETYFNTYYTNANYSTYSFIAE
ncbi:MAG: leucine-rich repeat protein [Eubacteriales bacterium]